MKERYIPAIIVLIAGAVTGILCIVQKFDTLFSLKLMLGVLISFYILGLIAKAIIVKVIGESKEQVETEESVQEDAEQSEEEGTAEEKAMAKETAMAKDISAEEKR